MRVYGDQPRRADPRVVLAGLASDLAAVWSAPPGLERHGRLVEAFVVAGELASALADVEFEAASFDDLSSTQDAVGVFLLQLAQAVDRSWRSANSDLGDESSVAPLAKYRLPTTVSLKAAEGFAFYAAYPEACLEAARALPEPPVVIGLRSIGAPLAALVAAASGAERIFTLRPTGPPFDRRPAVSPALEAALFTRPNALFAIVDEGPGLSGSSFGGVADWLEARGVARDRIVFFPSHPGDPGPEARPDHLARWRAARREVRTFDDLFMTPDSPAPLAGWFADLTGPPIAPLEDLSGGAWRSGRPDDAPAFPGQERRKFRLRTASGAYLIKFAGLGPDARAKFARAQALHAAGFTPEPLALRHGMLLERWIDGARPLQGAPPLNRLADYLAFRALSFPVEHPGAALAELVSMARANIAEALGEAAAARILDPWADADISALQARVRPVHVDARLHRWEWLDTPAGLLKTDALDHSQAHDLIGPQDLAWDVAGATAEFDLPPAEADHLQTLIEAKTPLDRHLVALMIPCYLAFQLGLWTFAADQDARAGRQRDGYADRLRRLGSSPV